MHIRRGRVTILLLFSGLLAGGFYLASNSKKTAQAVNAQPVVAAGRNRTERKLTGSESLEAGGDLVEPQAEAALIDPSEVRLPRVFGLSGVVHLEDVPQSSFKVELGTIAGAAQKFALQKLQDLSVPLNDLASLHVDPTGHLYYECAARADIRRSDASETPQAGSAAAPIISNASVPILTPPVRHSKPGSTKVIYLDFNGHTITGTQWNVGRGSPGDSNYRAAIDSYIAKPFTLDTDGTTFNDAEQTEIIRIWERIAEDYKPFDVDVTTEEPATITITTGRILITQSTDANGVDMPGGGTAAGIAYLDVFGDYNYVSTYSPALIYADKCYNYEDYIAEAASHEMGHNLSLSHDGTTATEYYPGHGSGETSWGSLMGAPYNRNVTQWSKGEYFNANNFQDDLAILSGHLGYASAAPADNNAAAIALSTSGNTFTGQGVIGTPAEADRFSFAVMGVVAVNFTVTPFRSAIDTKGGNLDVQVQVYDSTNSLIANVDPSSATTTSATVSAGLTTGTYYLRISGTGAGTPLASSPTGYTAYASLGQYTITGSTSTPTLPVFSSQPSAQSVTAGQSATFSTAATGNPSPSYQWQRRPSGSATWSNLAESAPYSGTTSGPLTISITTPAMNGDQIRCVATNIAGTTLGNAAALAVKSTLPIVDFNGDNKADLLWQNTATGERSIWLMNGTTLTAGVSIGLSPTEWSIAATADFNGDGKPDLLWQNTLTGDRTFWLMNGTVFSSSVALGTYSTDLMIAGAGDFNGDGKPDLVWQNTSTGARSVWLMNGTALSSIVDLGTLPPEWSIAGTGDFNADGKCDLIWQNTVTGERAIWLMNGTTVTTGVALGVYPQLQISGTGDYNADGKSDILWTNTVTGERVIWLMNGTTLSSSVSLGVVDLNWVLGRPVFRRALADFNNDGKSDLVWQNTATGDRAIWIMNGTVARTGLSLGNYPVAQWIAAVGDFNNDGKADLVWQNTSTGARSITLLNGTTILSTVSLGTYGTEWSINTAGDFNADGKPDLVWTNNSTGDRAIWLMDGAAFTGGVSLGNVSTQLQVAGSGDFNSDGQTDILWQNTITGVRTIWLMNGATHTSTVTLGTYAPEWSIVGTGDYNADGKPDLLWQNTITGERAIWLMNGTTFLSSATIGTFDLAWSIRN